MPPERVQNLPLATIEHLQSRFDPVSRMLRLQCSCLIHVHALCSRTWCVAHPSQVARVILVKRFDVQDLRRRTSPSGGEAVIGRPNTHRGVRDSRVHAPWLQQPKSDGLQPKSDGLQPNRDGLHFSAFPQDTGTAACGGGDQKHELRSRARSHQCPSHKRMRP